MAKKKLPTDQHILDPASEPRMRLLLEHLRKAFNQFFETRSLGYSDVLMGTHNFHKLIVCDTVSRVLGEHPDHQGEADGRTEDEKNEAAALVYETAKQTWVKAMDELIEKRLT